MTVDALGNKRTRTKLKPLYDVNYEEMLAAKSDGKLNKAIQPIGLYYRLQIDGKYRSVVDIRPEMNSNIAFTEALKAECEKNKTLVNSHQLHYEAQVEQGDVVRLEIESGNFLSFDQLLQENPAVVATHDFALDTLKSLVNVTKYLHSQGIRHICYSPHTVFVRKGDYAVMLLSHGSFYTGVKDQRELYGDDSCYVAPEVLEHGTIDDRCDVYSIGRFMQWLFDSASAPLEFRKAIAKAASQMPEDRYDSPEALLRAVQARKNTLRSAVTFAIATVIALIAVGIYFDMVPDTNPVEFVKPAPRQATDDLLDDGFSPEELGVVSYDSLGDDEKQLQREYEAKAEEIFRKKYAEEADRILSKIYDKEHMNNSEKKFAAESQSTIEELMKAQSEIASEAGLNPTRSQLIATEIIDKITEEKKAALGSSNSRGIQLPKR